MVRPPTLPFVQVFDRSAPDRLTREDALNPTTYDVSMHQREGTLHADVSLFLSDPACDGLTTCTTVDADHGRFETRTASVSHDIGWLDHHKWPGLAAIGKLVRTRELKARTGTKAEITSETLYYLLSTPLSADRFGQTVRSHWGVENPLHWCLDVIMAEDQARNRKDNGPHNLAVLRHMALNVMRRDKTKGSLRGKFKRAGWNEDCLSSLLALFCNAIALQAWDCVKIWG
jgi:predicted transposase YbfD/YdcC